MKQTIAEVQHGLFQGQYTLEDLVAECLNQAHAQKEINAFIRLWDEDAISRAQALDKKIKNKEKTGSLCGVVFSLKDVIAMEGKALTAASKILQGYTSPFSATVVDRILREDGIIIGSTNCDEFAMGSDNTQSYYGPTYNAIDKEKVAGGSSGGAAASVAINACHVGIGSDTGGSVRQPAAFHGLYGFKPSYGRLSRHGLIAYGSSFDQIGLIAKDPSFIFTAYQAMQGPDGLDSTLVDSSHHIGGPKNAYRVGWLLDAFEHESVDPQIKKVCARLWDKLKKEDGLDIEAFSFDKLDYLVPSYYILTAAEASSNLSRYDGVRFGHRSKEAKTLDEVYVKTRSQGFGPEVKRRIMLGTYVLCEGYFDAYYAKAQKLRTLLITAFDEIFGNYDVVLMPTTPTFAWSQDSDLTPVEIYLSDIFSILANILGIPSFSIPLKDINDERYFGVQILVKQYAEKQLEHFVTSYESIFSANL